MFSIQSQGHFIGMHTIRLRYPWTKQRHQDESDASRVNVPERDEDVADDESPCATTYTRNFNRPTGIESDDRVWLRITRWQGTLVSLRINGQPQPIGTPPLEIELSKQWAPHNQIEIQIDPAGGNPVRFDGDVTLEIQTGDDAVA
ncbi:hypothetical protein RMSM_05199 [Rhodopirellula maiorica SM1]|uniref:Uncharacterized protein n=2 Tax=Novipirellula TaxID=2795426 RepID=M5RFJ5_9BACT|nr:hypothetical protein RMSM_05199 [Rhodopirellula maiorica SM1]